jgi:hypothetical protein
VLDEILNRGRISEIAMDAELLAWNDIYRRLHELQHAEVGAMVRG